MPIKGLPYEGKNKWSEQKPHSASDAFAETAVYAQGLVHTYTALTLA